MDGIEKSILTFSAKYIKVGTFTGTAFGPVIFSQNGFDICLDGGTDTTKMNIVICLEEITKCLSHFSSNSTINTSINVLFLEVSQKCADRIRTQIQNTMKAQTPGFEISYMPNSSNEYMKYIILSLGDIISEQIQIFKDIFAHGQIQGNEDHNIVAELTVNQVAVILKQCSKNSSAGPSVEKSKKSSKKRKHSKSDCTKSGSSPKKLNTLGCVTSEDVIDIESTKNSSEVELASQNSSEVELASEVQESKASNNSVIDLTEPIVIKPETEDPSYGISPQKGCSMEYTFHHLSEQDFSPRSNSSTTDYEARNKNLQCVPKIIDVRSLETKDSVPKKKAVPKRHRTSVERRSVDSSVDKLSAQAETTNIQPFNSPALPSPSPGLPSSSPGPTSPVNAQTPAFNPSVMGASNQTAFPCHPPPLHPAFPAANLQTPSVTSATLNVSLMAIGKYKGMPVTILDMAVSGMGIWFARDSPLKSIKSMKGYLNIPGKDIIRIMAYFSDSSTSAIFVYVSPIFAAKLGNILQQNIEFKTYEQPHDKFNSNNLIVLLLDAVPAAKALEVQQLCFKMGMTCGMGPLLQVIDFTIAGKYLRVCFSNESEQVLSDIEHEEKQNQKKRASNKSKNGSVIAQNTLTMTCPFSKKIMENPVKNINCGHNYDRKVVVDCISTADKQTGRDSLKCPVPNCINTIPLKFTDLEPNVELNQVIWKYLVNQDVVELD